MRRMQAVTVSLSSRHGNPASDSARLNGLATEIIITSACDRLGKGKNMSNPRPLKLPIGAELEHLGWWKRTRRAAKTVLGLDREGRDFPLYPDDTFLVSYPRSGNTWTRFLIANLIDDEHPATFANIDARIPEPAAMSRRQLASVPRPRIIKSHEYFDPRYRRLIYLVRDPRDVVVSNYYFQLKKRFIPNGYPMDEYVPAFVSTGIDRFASWGENVAGWLATRSSSSDFLLLKYEEMTKEPERELSKIASFLNIPVNHARIARAVELSSVQRMRELEKEEMDSWKVTRNTRKDIPFIRTATPGAWRSVLSNCQVEQIECAWWPIMTALGYEATVANPAQPNPNLTWQGQSPSAAVRFTRVA